MVQASEAVVEPRLEAKASNVQHAEPEAKSQAESSSGNESSCNSSTSLASEAAPAERGTKTRRASLLLQEAEHKLDELGSQSEQTATLLASLEALLADSSKLHAPPAPEPKKEEPKPTPPKAPAPPALPRRSTFRRASIADTELLEDAEPPASPRPPMLTRTTSRRASVVSLGFDPAPASLSPASSVNVSSTNNSKIIEGAPASPNIHLRRGPSRAASFMCTTSSKLPSRRSTLFNHPLEDDHVVTSLCGDGDEDDEDLAVARQELTSRVSALSKSFSNMKSGKRMPSRTTSFLIPTSSMSQSPTEYQLTGRKSFVQTRGDPVMLLRAPSNRYSLDLGSDSNLGARSDSLSGHVYDSPRRRPSFNNIRDFSHGCTGSPGSAPGSFVAPDNVAAGVLSSFSGVKPVVGIV